LMFCKCLPLTHTQFWGAYLVFWLLREVVWDSQVASDCLHHKNTISSHLPKEAVLWSYLLYLLPKLTFLIRASTLMDTQCHLIHSPTLMAVLPKLHSNRHTSRSILYGPLFYGGLNHPYLYSTQGLGQLKLLLDHLHAQDKTCKLILISHGHLHLLVSTSSNVLNTSYKLWIFLADTHLKVHVPARVNNLHVSGLATSFITRKWY
jgi:hypothetical protein